MKDMEIEIKVKIEKSGNLKKFLKEKAVFVSENQQIDEYFTPSHRNFLDTRPVEEWFRIREEKGKISINYKKWHYKNGISQFADEFETEIGDKETVKKIFNAIDLKFLATVDKTRKKFNYKNYEIALDSVVGLGNFVEIEYKGKDTNDYEAVKKGMIAFLKKIDCGKIEIENCGYPMLLLFPKGTK